MLNSKSNLCLFGQLWYFLNVLQALYDFTADATFREAPTGLPELHVDGFDTEQVWGQLDSSAGPSLKQLRKRFRSLGQDFVLLDRSTEEALDGGLLKCPSRNLRAALLSGHHKQIEVHVSSRPCLLPDTNYPCIW